MHQLQLTYFILQVVPLSTEYGCIPYFAGGNGEWYQRYVCVLGSSIRWLVLLNCFLFEYLILSNAAADRTRFIDVIS